MTPFLFCLVIAVLFCVGMLGVFCTAVLEITENHLVACGLGVLTLLVFITVVVLCILAVAGVVV